MLFPNGVRSKYIYGTAWKKDETLPSTLLAIKAGFRAIDTAAQPKTYNESDVGEAVRQAVAQGIATRQVIHIATKYTPPAGQDADNLRYDPSASITDQVIASVNSSLHNFRPATPSTPPSTPTAPHPDAYIDCVLLHSPFPTLSATLEAWAALSSFVPTRIRSLGISNVTLPTLQSLCASAPIQPTAVQNRFYKQTGYDFPLRAFCAERSIRYESFWTLTSNPHLLVSPLVRGVATKLRLVPSESLYALIRALGVVCLNGTSDEERMVTDLAAIKRVEEWRTEEGNEEVWAEWVKEFEELLRAQGP